MSCNGNVYNIGMGCCQPVLGPIENYYTKWQTDDKIEEAISGISAVTIDEVQEMIDEAVSGITVSGVTEEQMNEAIASAKTEIEAEISTALTQVDDALTAHTADTGIHVTSAEKSTWNAKAEPYSAGTGIDITNNVISATGGGGEVSSVITSGDTNAVAGGAVYDKVTYEETYTAWTSAYTATVGFESNPQTLDKEYSIFSIKVPADRASGYVFLQLWDANGNALLPEMAGFGLSLASTMPSSLTDSGENEVVEPVFDHSHTYVTYTFSSSKLRDVVSYSLYQWVAIDASINWGYEATENIWLNEKVSANTEAIAAKADPYFAGRAIDIDSANFIQLDLPISAGTATGSITEGHNSNTASAYYSHAEGYYTIAGGQYSHAEGKETITNNNSEHASGVYNVSNSASTTFGDSGNTLFSVGNGTASNARHNAFEVRQNADIYVTSGGTDILLQDNLASSTEKTTWNSKPNVWCGDETAWGQISGGTLDPQCIYLVY